MMQPAIMRGLEQAQRPPLRVVREEVVMVTDNETDQEALPEDGLGAPPITTYDELWAHLPEGKRGKGWVEPGRLHDPDDPHALDPHAANYFDPPQRRTTFYADFVRRYSVVVADYIEAYQEMEDSLCGPDKVAPKLIPEDLQKGVAEPFGWSVDHARELRKAAVAIFTARMAGMHPYVGDVRLVRHAQDRRAVGPAEEG